MRLKSFIIKKYTDAFLEAKVHSLRSNTSFYQIYILILQTSIKVIHSYNLMSIPAYVNNKP